MTRYLSLFALAVVALSGCGTMGKGPAVDRGHRAAAPVIVALDKFYHDHGHYPAKLAELVPKYLQEVHEIDEARSWENQAGKFQYHLERKHYTLTFVYWGYDGSIWGSFVCSYDSVNRKWDYSFIA